MGPSTGVSILIHAPDEIPNSIKSFTEIKLTEYTTFIITPKITKTSADLYDVKPELLVI